MQRAMLDGEPIRHGFRPNENGAIPHRLAPCRSPQNPAAVPVTYRDGAVLTFLFDRSTTIVDLMAMISRAGTVRKVVL
ncbi:MAG: hypothetical protein ACYCSS_15320 [Sulfuriferula sp.]